MIWAAISRYVSCSSRPTELQLHQQAMHRRVVRLPVSASVQAFILRIPHRLLSPTTWLAFIKASAEAYWELRKLCFPA